MSAAVETSHFQHHGYRHHDEEESAASSADSAASASDMYERDEDDDIEEEEEEEELFEEDEDEYGEDWAPQWGRGQKRHARPVKVSVGKRDVVKARRYHEVRG